MEASFSSLFYFFWFIEHRSLDDPDTQKYSDLNMITFSAFGPYFVASVVPFPNVFFGSLLTDMALHSHILDLQTKIL